MRLSTALISGRAQGLRRANAAATVSETAA